MMIRRVSIGFLAAVVALPLFASVGSAWGDPKWSRPGWYVGFGFGGATDFLEDQIEDEFPIVEIEGTWSANVRAGYRVVSWFAFEALYEGAYGYQMDVSVPNIGTIETDFDTHSVMGNFKFILPTWRFQPYLGLGFGAQLGKFTAIGDLDLDDTQLGGRLERWDFVFRPSLGLDSYVTKNILINIEIAPSVRVKNWKNIPSAPTDNVSMTVGAGVQWRF